MWLNPTVEAEMEEYDEFQGKKIQKPVDSVQRA